MAEQDIFTPEAENPLNQLVGEGKKFKTPEDLAKSKIEADAFIESQNRRIREMETELHSRLSVEEQLRKLQEDQDRIEQDANNRRENTTRESGPALNKDDLAKLVREVTQQDRTQEQAANNINSAAAKLAEHFGDSAKAQDAVKRKADELGVSPDFLRDVAARSPTAFLKQFDLDAPSRSDAPLSTRSDVNTEAARTRTDGQGPKPGTYAAYDELRKADPAKYFSPEVQIRLHRDAFEAEKRGEDFFKR